MSRARIKVARMRRKRKEKKPFLTTKTSTYTRKDGEKRKSKTTKLRVGKAGIIASKSTDTKVGKATRGDVVKRVVKRYKPMNKRGSTTVTTYTQGLKRVKKKKEKKY